MDARQSILEDPSRGSKQTTYLPWAKKKEEKRKQNFTFKVLTKQRLYTKDLGESSGNGSRIHTVSWKVGGGIQNDIPKGH